MQTDLTESNENSLDLELSDLYHPSSKYTSEEKVAAVLSYVVTGTSKRAAKNLKIQEGIDIPHSTIRYWKASALWWPDVYAECKKKKQEELDGKFTEFIHTAIEVVVDRVKNGNFVIDKATGEQIRLPMGGKEAAWCMGVFFDKRQLIRGDPTSRIEKVSETDRLDSLEKSFKQMSSSVQGLNANLIEGEVVKE